MGVNDRGPSSLITTFAWIVDASCFELLFETFIRPDFLAMFPGRWPNFPESMWNFGWSAPSITSPQSAVPPGQFCGSDPSYQHSQAQAQAQISALQQQNALLNQQLHNQSQSHINHLQQLLPHHQIQQQLRQVSPPVQPSPSAPTPHAPEPPSPQVPAPSPTETPFNPAEMLQHMKTTFENSLAAVVEKSQERPPHHTPHPSPPSISVPSRSSHHRHLSPPPLPQPSIPSDVVLHHQRLTRGQCQLIAVLDDAGFHLVIVCNPHGTSHLHVIVIDLVIDATVADPSC